MLSFLVLEAHPTFLYARLKRNHMPPFNKLHVKDTTMVLLKADTQASCARLVENVKVFGITFNQKQLNQIIATALDRLDFIEINRLLKLGAILSKQQLVHVRQREVSALNTHQLKPLSTLGTPMPPKQLEALSYQILEKALDQISELQNLGVRNEVTSLLKHYPRSYR